MVGDRHLVEIDEIIRTLEQNVRQRCTQTHEEVISIRNQIELSRRLLDRSFAALADNNAPDRQRH